MNCVYCGFDIVEDDIPVGEVVSDESVLVTHEICADLWEDEIIEAGSSYSDGFHRYDYDKNGTPPHPEWIRPTL